MGGIDLEAQLSALGYGSLLSCESKFRVQLQLLMLLGLDRSSELAFAVALLTVLL
jgi:hypothetical protein